MKNHKSIIQLVLVLFISGCVPTLSTAQQYAGNWEGKLAVGSRKLGLVLHINGLADNRYAASMDIPDQKLFNFQASAVDANDHNITLQFSALGIKIIGKLDGNKKLSCLFEQSGQSLPFELKNTGEPTAGKKFDRPQTPAPPYPYSVEEVEFTGLEGSLHYGGTLTYPNDPGGGAKQYPAILLLTGSGPQDRDETMFDHKPFAILADRLTKAGYAVMRVDDRGMGRTTGNFQSSTTGDFANDAEAAIAFLKSRKEIDTARIGLLGHSEGGLMAVMVASKRRDIDFIILMATPAADPIELAAEQSADILVSQGVPESRIAEYRPLMRDIFSAILSAPDKEAAMQAASGVFVKWQSAQGNKTTRLTTGVTDEKSMQTFINRLISLLHNPWYQYFMKLHPADFYKNLSCKVLALYGEKDIQVDPVINSNLLREFFAGRKTGETEINILPGLNHLFQHCRKCTFSEYAEIEETLAPELLTIIEQWVTKNR